MNSHAVRGPADHARLVAAWLLVAATATVAPQASAATWTYDFGTTTGTFSLNSSSVSGTAGAFLPSPPSGTARVRVGSGQGGFQLLNPGTAALGTNSELMMIAPTAASLNKFSVFDYGSANVYHMAFSAILSGSSGDWTLCLGDGSNYSDNNTVNPAQAVTALRFSMTDSGVTSQYLQGGSTYSATGLTTAGIVKDTVLDFKLFGNDAAAGTAYRLGDTAYTLNADSWDLWLGNARIATSIAQNTSWTGTQIDSLMFFGQSSLANSATVRIDDIAYANELTTPTTGTYWAPAVGGGGSGTWAAMRVAWATSSGTLGSGTQTASSALVFANAAGTVTVSGSVAAVAGMQVSTSGYVFTGGTLGLTGATAAANTVTVDATVSSTINSVIAGSAGMTKAGGGTLVLGGANTLSGGITVSSGTLVVTTASIVGAVSGSSAAAIVFDQSSSGTYTGLISGASPLTKRGAGTVSVASLQAFTGPTTISAGALALSGTGGLSSSVVTVDGGGRLDVTGRTGGLALAGGQTLAGTGSVAGLVVVGTASTVSPGASPGTLAVGTMEFAAGGNYNWQVHAFGGGAGTGWDLLSGTGALLVTAGTGGSRFNVNLWSLSSIAPDVSGTLAGFNKDFDYRWKVAEFAGGITGFSADEFLVQTAPANGTGGFANDLNGTFSMAQGNPATFGTANQLFVVYTALPEPSTLALAGLGLAAAGWAGRRRVRARGKGSRRTTVSSNPM